MITSKLFRTTKNRTAKMQNSHCKGERIFPTGIENNSSASGLKQKRFFDKRKQLVEQLAKRFREKGLSI